MTKSVSDELLAIADTMIEQGHHAKGALVVAGANEITALLASLEDREAKIEELKREAELFDEDHADQNRMVDRIADLIGLPHDQELDTTAFELWFSANASPTSPQPRCSGVGESV
jgi:HPt (histidine-containing phosphotransfer) domain-containing protein